MNVFATHPVLANLAAGSATLLTGDLVAQAVEVHRRRRSSFDRVRAAAARAREAAGDVPITLTLFRFVDGVFTLCGVSKTATSLPLSVARAVAFTVPGALLRNPAYLIVTALTEHAGRTLVGLQPPDAGGVGHTLSKLRERLSGGTLREILTNSLRVWIPANTVGFYVVPPHLRPLYTVSVQVCWNTYLSLASHRQPAAAAASEPENDPEEGGVLLRER